ncbi:MAG: Alkanesulfonate monooxygenase [Ilumatobacteraceae bacterium]|nr:Alkanesulfonate monooxygenase [Ilumatobacteraceae bacterium]
MSEVRGTVAGREAGEVEIIGWVAPQESSEIMPLRGPTFDLAVLTRTAQVHETAGFDRVLIGYFTNGADGFMVGAHVAAVTERLGLLLAHRPGFVAPTLAARKLATLDLVSAGRLAVHIISGGSDPDQARDGDYVDHDARYRRSAEYVDLLRETWAAHAAFDHAGEFYRVEGALSDVYPANGVSIPVYGGGGSDAAVALLSAGLDTFMVWGEPLADTVAFYDRVRAAAVPTRSEIGLSVSTRPILGPTDGAAWDRARGFLDQVVSRTGGRRAPAPENVASQRLLESAARSEVFDRCLWTPLAAATGARGNSTALVGSPETVAEALADYVDIGATTLLIRGYEPLADADEYGRELIPRVRAIVAERAARRRAEVDAHPAAAAGPGIPPPAMRGAPGTSRIASRSS